VVWCGSLPGARNGDAELHGHAGRQLDGSVLGYYTVASTFVGGGLRNDGQVTVIGS
jgi:hypothetical protein